MIMGLTKTKKETSAVNIVIASCYLLKKGQNMTKITIFKAKKGATRDYPMGKHLKGLSCRGFIKTGDNINEIQMRWVLMQGTNEKYLSQRKQLLKNLIKLIESQDYRCINTYYYNRNNNHNGREDISIK